MYALGHLGVVLLAFAPIALHLRRTKRTHLAAAGTVQVAGLSTSPDVDLLFAGVSHRGITHTLWFALAVGSTLAVLASARTTTQANHPQANHRRQPTATRLASGFAGALPKRFAGVLTTGYEGALLSGFVGTFAVATHLAGDVLTPMGIQPLAPVVDVHLSLALVAAADPTANRALFALGCLATFAGWWADTDHVPWRTPTTHLDDGASR